MARYVVALAAVLGAAFADDAAYNAPSVGYGAPSSPSVDYGAPQEGYGAPSTGYDAQEYAAPTGYEYTAAQESGDAFDLSKITELIPLFLAVFAAIIVAQLFAPLISMIFGAKVDLATGILAPLSGAKRGLIDAILAPFGLMLCDTAGGRSLNLDLSKGFSMDADSVINLLTKANEIYSEFS